MRTSDDEYLRKLFVAARRHYKEKRTNSEIAKELRVSATEVSRLIKAAELEGIVAFTFDPPRLAGLQNRILETFQLTEAIVVPSSQDPAYQREILGSAAARYFDEIIDRLKVRRIAIGAGTTTQALIDALPRRERNIELYPTRLIGMGPDLAESADAMVHLSLLWDKSGRRPGMAHYVTVLPIERGEDPKEYMDRHTTRPKVQQVLTEMFNVDCVFSSLGPMPTSNDARDVFSGNKTAKSTLVSRLHDIGKLDDLERLGAVGEISYSFFGEGGEAISELEPFFLTIGVERLRGMAARIDKKVVVTAGEPNKVRPLRAALKGRLFNVLITDEHTATELLT